MVPFQRTTNVPDIPVALMGVPLRSTGTFVTQEFLDVPQIRSILQQMSGKAVTERMDTYSRLPCRSPAVPPNRPASEGIDVRCFVNPNFDHNSQKMIDAGCRFVKFHLSIARFFSSGGIFSIAYRRAVRGMRSFRFITKSNTSF